MDILLRDILYIMRFVALLYITTILPNSSAWIWNLAT